jgi:hypothetical protein
VSTSKLSADQSTAGNILSPAGEQVSTLACAQLSDQVIYPNTSVDDKGDALTGARKYVLPFDAGKTPPVSVFWNIAMYASDMLFIENDCIATALAARRMD